VSAVLEDADADATVYWEAGTVADPAAHNGWDGTNGPAAETTGTVVRAVSNLVADTTYTYAFYATNGTFETAAWSIGLTFVTPFSDAQAPAFTSAVPGIASVALGWEVNDTHATSYILQRSTNSSSGPYTYLDVGDVTSYTDTSVSPDTTYYYGLAATNGNNGSATSFSAAETNATTLPLVGDVIAEYLFSGDYASSDADAATTASDVTPNGHTASIASGYYEAESDEVGSYFSGGDYLTFTVSTVNAQMSLTALEWNYGTHSPHQFGSGIFSDAYAGFDQSTDVIPGTYVYTHGVNIDIAGDSSIVDLSVHPGFQNLSNTSVVFRIYMGDGASFGGRFHRYDNIRVYATVTVPGGVSVSDVASASITTNSALLSATLTGTNADVTAYWEAGVVVDPASHTGWDGSDGPTAAGTGTVVRSATGLAADTLYSYAFYATNTVDGPTDWSDVGTFVTDLSAAQAPVFTSAVADATSVTLGWSNNATYATANLLQWSTNDVDYTTLAPLASSATSYTHTPLESGTTYYYQLAATNSGNGSATAFSSARTNAATDAVLSAPTVDNGNGPTPGVGTATLSGQVLTGSGLTAVRIYFGDEDGGTNNPANWDTNYVFSVGDVTVGVPFPTNVTGLIYGLTYSYRVYAANAAGAAWSTATNFTTLPRQAATGMVSQGQFNTATVTASDEFSGREPREAFDGTGLSGETHTAGTTGSRGDQWMSAGGGPASEWLKVNLGGTYLLDYLKVWNWRDDGSSRGIQQCDLYVAASDPGNNSDGSGLTFDPTGWTMANENQIFSIGRGDGLASDASISMGGVSAAYFAIKVDSNYGDGTYTGLAEMQFYWRDADPMAVENTAAANVTDQQADLVGELNADGAVLTVTVHCSTTSNATSGAWALDGSKSTVAIGTYTNVTDLAVTGTVSSLTPDTTYYYTMVASNALTNIWASPNASFDTGFAAAQAPVFTSAVASASEIALGWEDKAATETGYVLRRSAVSDSGPWTFSTNLPGNTESYTDDDDGAGLAAGTTYYYQLAATNSGNGSATLFSLCATNAGLSVDVVWSLSNPATDPIGATEATANAVVNLDLDNCVLVWDTTDKGTGSIGAWTGSNVVGATNGAPALAVAADLTGLSPDTAYVWRYYGTNSTYSKEGWSDPTNFVTALSAAQAPVFTSAQAMSIASIQLDWTDSATHETGYILQRSTTEGSGYSTIASLGPTVTTYTDSSVVHSTTYYYRLAATNSANGSATTFSLAATNAATDGVVAAFDFYTAPVQPGFANANPSATSGGVSVNVTGSYIARSRTIGVSHELDDLMKDVYLLNPSGTVTLSGLEPRQSYFVTLYGHDADSYDGGVTAWTWGGNTIATITNNVADYKSLPSYGTGKVYSDQSGNIVLVGTKTSGSYGMLNGLHLLPGPPPGGTLFRFR